MNKKLSILIPTIRKHERLYDKLLIELRRQCEPYGDQVEILSDHDENDPTGAKRNRLLGRASGEMLASVDADDWIAPNYVELLIKAEESGCDCASLRGAYSVDGVFDGVFEHSIRYKKWETVYGDIKYLRTPTPLNCIRSSIAKQFKYPEITFGEDFAWSEQIHNSGLLKTEYYIDQVIYYYNKITGSPMPEKIKYSQNDESLFIDDFYLDKPIGKILDIGAYDACRFSNSRSLIEKGWHAVMAEPAPANFKGIEHFYRDNPNVTVLNVAVGDGTRKIRFFDSNGDAIGTTEIPNMERWQKAGVTYTEIEVHQIDTEAFMNLYAKDADAISIDVEGTNIQLFRGIPDWVWEQISLLVIEHDGYDKEIEDKLVPFGFFKLHINGENIILGKC